MKKLLALVLALVMTMSLAVSANAFTDDKDVKYTEAVEVLADMGILKGYENGSFNPNGNITRAEAAAILYRVYTKDVAEKSKDLYAGYGNFADVTSAYSWAAGVIGYCANAEIIKGYNETTFGPADNVTGYQILAMLLRAVGYDKNGEFTGNGWETQVAKVAQQADVLKNVGTENLAQPASRQLVAELVFRTLVVAEQVSYTPAFGYVANNVVTTSTATLGVQNFKLAQFDSDDEDNGRDKWGRPQYGWTYNVGAEATIWVEDHLSYTTAQTQCDIAADAGIKNTETYDVYTNGVKNLTKNGQTIKATNTKATVGAQGQILEVYDDEIVIIDTYLAKVEKVTANTYDKAGHLRSPAKLELTVYTSYNGETLNLTSSYTDWTYAEGDMLLINVVSKNGELTTDVDFLGYATSIEGNQSKIWTNQKQHTVDGTTYSDAIQFKHNEATDKANYTWFFDQFGNLIGSFKIETVYNYAVLTSIKYNTSDDTATGSLIYMDGKTEEGVVITAINDAETTYSYDANNFGPSGDGETFYVTTSAKINKALDKAEHGYINGHLYKVVTNTKNDTVALAEVTNELNAVKVYNKGLTISDGKTTVKVDNATMFLVLTDGEFTTYTGVKELPNMINCEVDYVLNSNGTAKYVYIVGDLTTSTAVSNDLVVVTTNTWYDDLEDGIYAVNVNVNDEEVIIKTEKYEDVVEVLTAETAVDKLFYITYENGLAIAAEPVAAGWTTVGKTDAGANIYAKKLAVTDYANDVLYDGDYRYYVEGVEVIGTALDDVENFDYYNVYVVFTVDAGGNRVASTVYAIYNSLHD